MNRSARGGTRIKRFERSNGLDTALLPVYNNNNNKILFQTIYIHTYMYSVSI